VEHPPRRSARPAISASEKWIRFAALFIQLLDGVWIRRGAPARIPFDDAVKEKRNG
jgi:hypothetical protein